MSRRSLMLSFASLSVLSVIAVGWLDPAVARWAPGAFEPMVPVFRAGTTLLEVLFGFPVSKFALGFLLLGVGAVLLLFPQHRPLARAAVFVAATHLTTRLAAGMLKNVFLRERPFEAGPDFVGTFFVGGSAFPSGHAAHFWSLYFALALLLPRWRVPLLVVPLFVSVARVAVGDHYPSDVLASAALSALAALAFAHAFGIPDVAARAQAAPRAGGLVPRTSVASADHAA